MTATVKSALSRPRDMLARCLQHEIDHLDGMLYTDRMKPGTRLYLVDDEDDEAGADEPPYPALASS